MDVEAGIDADGGRSIGQPRVAEHHDLPELPHSHWEDASVVCLPPEDEQGLLAGR